MKQPIQYTDAFSFSENSEKTKEDESLKEGLEQVEKNGKTSTPDVKSSSSKRRYIIKRNNYLFTILI